MLAACQDLKWWVHPDPRCHADPCADRHRAAASAHVKTQEAVAEPQHGKQVEVLNHMFDANHRSGHARCMHSHPQLALALGSRATNRPNDSASGCASNANGRAISAVRASCSRLSSNIMPAENAPRTKLPGAKDDALRRAWLIVEALEGSSACFSRLASM